MKHSTLIVARMEPGSGTSVARLFQDFDASEMPGLMGTRRRQLFHFNGLYFHLQDFDDDRGEERIESVRAHPSFVRISEDLKEFITAYDPLTWRSPKDAMATRFYHWAAQ
ncbi:TcmI family type II polyketide cyclase [Spirillospora sp. CA-294931]|uniref:TcmI family type II polyketide cyclase n=1 Tax=Spirillospora sp. CA-294931 TaxID=3240042 RepID=UPI003D91D39E